MPPLSVSDGPFALTRTGTVTAAYARGTIKRTKAITKNTVTAIATRFECIGYLMPGSVRRWGRVG